MTDLFASASGEMLLIGHDEIRHAVERLRDTASTDWLTLETFEVPLPGRGAINIPAPRKPGVRRLSVYDERFLRDPAGLQIIRARMAAGEEARIHPRIDHRLRIADASAGLVIMAPSWTGFGMLVHSDPIVTMLRRQFERAWDQATPFDALPSRAFGAATRSA